MPKRATSQRSAAIPRRWLVAGIGVLLLIALSVGGVVLFEVMKTRRLHHYIQWGDEAVASGQYSQATVHYTNALKMTPKDMGLQEKLADAFDRAGQFEDGAACWESILSTGPGENAIADMNRLFQDDLMIVRIKPSESAAGAVKHAAIDLAAAQPGNRAAIAYARAADVIPWLSGDGNYTDQIAKAAIDLADIVRQDPDNLDGLRFAALTDLHRAGTAHVAGHDADAAAALTRVASLCTELIANHPDQAGLNLDAAQILGAVADAALAETGDTAQAVAATALARQAANNALHAVKPGDPIENDVTLTAASIAAASGDPQAENLFRAAVSRNPGSLPARLAYAQYLAADPEQYAQAADLLAAALTTSPIAATSQPASDRRPVTFNNLTHPIDPAAMELNRLISLARIRIQMIPTASDLSQYTADLSAADRALADAAAKLPTDSPVVMMLKAQLDGSRGRLVQAIEDADQAVELLKKFRSAADPDLLFNVAQAYIAAGQSQQAQASIQSLLEQFPSYWPARFMLARLLMRDNVSPDQKGASLAAAAAIIDTLKAALPNDPRLHSLLAELDWQYPIDNPDRATSAAEFAKIPESTRVQKIQKADVALAIGLDDDVVRLLTPLNTEHPDNRSIAGLLSSALQRLGKTVQAKAVLAATAGHSSGQDDIPSLVAAARLALAQTDLAKASGLLARASAMPGDQTPVTEAQLDVALAQKDWTGAESYAQALTKQNADQADGLTYRVRIDLARKLVHQAVVDATKLKDKIPDFSGTWSLLGLSDQDAGDFDNAAQSYAHALSLKSNDHQSLKGLAECDEMLGRQSDAWNVIQTARRLYPDDSDFRRLESDHELKYGNSTALVSAAVANANANPNDPAAAVAAARAQLAAATWQQSTDPAAAAAKTEQARQMLIADVAKWPNDLPASALLASADLQAGQGEAGLAALTKFAAQPQWQDRPEPQVILADYLNRQGKFDDAIAALRSAYAASSHSPALARQLASLLAAHNHVDDAVALLKPLAATDADAQKQIVDTLIAAGRPADAEQFARSLLAANANSSRRLSLLAWALMRESKFDQAAASIDQALSIDPADPTLLYERGILQLSLPRPDATAAVTDLAAARDASPADPEIRLALANAYRLQNNNAAAIGELQTALPLVPSSKAARLSLMDLYSKANPPQWDHVADLTSAAEQNPTLRTDPIWSRLDSRMWLARGKLDLALTSIKTALTLGPDDLDVLHDALDIFLDKKDYPATIATADDAIHLSPQAAPWWALVARAEAHSRAGDKAGAAADFAAALAATDAGADNTDHAVSIITADAAELGAADALARIGHRADAHPIWKLVSAQILVTAHDPSAPAAIDALVSNLGQLDAADRPNALRLAVIEYANATPPQWDKVLDAYKSLLTLLPDDLDALNNLACVLNDSITPPRPAEALTYAQHAYDVMQKSGAYNAAVADTYGWALVQTGQSPAAIAILKTAAPQLDLPDPHYHLAEALLDTGQPQDAQSQLRQAQSMLDRQRGLNQPVDPVLAGRISDAQSRTATAIAQEAAASAAQTAPATQAAGGN